MSDNFQSDELTTAINTSLLHDVTSGLSPTTAGSRFRSSSSVGAVTGSSPWLWAPHVAIGALLLALMVASFVRFHCKYGHKYRTGSQTLGPNGFRFGPKNAWMTSDKKLSSSSTRLPSMSATTATSVISASSSSTGRHHQHGQQHVTGAGRSAAVIVLRPVSDATASSMSSGSRRQLPIARRSADPVLLGRRSVVDLFPADATTTTSAASSNVSVDTVQQTGGRQQDIDATVSASDAAPSSYETININNDGGKRTLDTVWNGGSGGGRRESTSGIVGRGGLASPSWVDIGTESNTIDAVPLTHGRETTSFSLSRPDCQQQQQQQQDVRLSHPTTSTATLRPTAVAAKSPTSGRRGHQSAVIGECRWGVAWPPSTLPLPPSSLGCMTSSPSSLSPRGTLLRPQPTPAQSPSIAAQSADTDRLLLLDDCDDRLLAL